MSVDKLVYSELVTGLRRKPYLLNLEALTTLESRVKKYIDNNDFSSTQDNGTREQWLTFLKNIAKEKLITIDIYEEWEKSRSKKDQEPSPAVIWVLRALNAILPKWSDIYNEDGLSPEERREQKRAEALEQGYW